MDTFKNLFSPITIGNVRIKNRIALAPINNFNQMDTAYGTITQRCVEYYAERIRGGVGHIITGVFKVENEIETCMIGDQFRWPMLTEKSMPEYVDLADYARSLNVKIFVQLSAGPGRVTNPRVINTGHHPVSASDNNAFFAPDVTCRALETGEVEQIVRAFGRAAEICKAAGFDGIEVHGHEGYLIDQFTTALWNRRTDKYGGDLQGRFTFPIEILQEIKKCAGADFAVTYRYGVKHFIKSATQATLNGEGEIGRDVPESVQAAGILEAAGYDAIHLDAGCYESLYYSHPPNYFHHGFIGDMVKQVKDAVNVPVLAASRFDLPEIAEATLEEGKADVIVLGRALLADSEWARKVAEGRIEDIRPCIGCHEGCMRRPGLGGPLGCSVNPECGREKIAAPLFPAPGPSKKILVIGGGVAGMEAARAAAAKGHRVTLLEKTDQLGGHFKEISQPGYKKDIRRLYDWYKHQVAKSGVEVRLNTLATEEMILAERANAVIVATGSTYRMPKIPGIENMPAYTSSELYANPAKAGDRVVVLGGGTTGTEAAYSLAKYVKSVTLVEQTKNLASTLFRVNRQMLLDLIEDLKVEILDDTTCLSVNRNAVTVACGDGTERRIPCDTLVVAVGMKAESALYDKLEGKIADLYLIGDGKAPREIHDAIFEGYIVGNAL